MRTGFKKFMYNWGCGLLLWAIVIAYATVYVLIFRRIK